LKYIFIDSRYNNILFTWSLSLCSYVKMATTIWHHYVLELKIIEIIMRPDIEP